MKKKILATIMLAVAVLSLMAGCGKKVECEFCGETKVCKTKAFFEETVSICDDCLAEFE